jgi:hypothetical protein
MDEFYDGRVVLHHGDMRAVIQSFASPPTDFILCDGAMYANSQFPALADGRLA